MNICWDNLEGFYLVKRTKEFRKGYYSYIEMDACVNCGKPYLMNKYKPTKHCCVSCGKYGSGYTHGEEARKKIGVANLGNKKMLGKHHSKETKKLLSKITSSKIGPKSSGWKGGIIEKNVPLYDTYSDQIDWVEKTRPIYIDNIKLMEVTCSKCKTWFVPTLSAVWDRLRYIKGQKTSECGFYCSDGCKQACSVFNQHVWPKDHKPHKVYKSDQFTRNELKIWREEVLKRENHICEYCGEEATIAHHSRPKKLEPFFALDPDYGFACCESCHYKYGHSGDCSFWALARKKC